MHRQGSRSGKRAERKARESTSRRPAMVTARPYSGRAQIDQIEKENETPSDHSSIWREFLAVVLAWLLGYVSSTWNKFGFKPETIEKITSGLDQEILDSFPELYWLRRHVLSVSMVEIPDSASGYKDAFEHQYGMVEEKAKALAEAVDEEVLISLPPIYWVLRWLSQFAIVLSASFDEFAKHLKPEEPKSFTFDGDANSTTIPVIRSDKNGLDGKDDRHVKLMLESERKKTGKKILRYHTTSWANAENIARDVISLVHSLQSQDFGGVTPSFYVNHTWAAAVDWGRTYGGEFAIMVFDVTKVDDQERNFLDLSDGDRLWQTVVSKSRLLQRNEADKSAIVTGPQAKYIKATNFGKEPPKKHPHGFSQTAYKTLKVCDKLHAGLLGIVLASKKAQ